MNIQTTIYNFIKTIECQRFILNKSIKEYIQEYNSKKYPSKNLNSIWFSCNWHFKSGIYIYLHKYQKLIKKRFSTNIDISIIDIIEKNTNTIYKYFNTCITKEEFISKFKQFALNGFLDNYILKA